MASRGGRNGAQGSLAQRKSRRESGQTVRDGSKESTRVGCHRERVPEMRSNETGTKPETNMGLLQIEDAVSTAEGKTRFIANTLLMASSAQFEVEEDWFGELSIYVSDVVDILESVRGSIYRTRTASGQPL